MAAPSPQPPLKAGSRSSWRSGRPLRSRSVRTHFARALPLVGLLAVIFPVEWGRVGLAQSRAPSFGDIAFAASPVSRIPTQTSRTVGAPKPAAGESWVWISSYNAEVPEEERSLPGSSTDSLGTSSARDDSPHFAKENTTTDRADGEGFRAAFTSPGVQAVAGDDGWACRVRGIPLLYAVGGLFERVSTAGRWGPWTDEPGSVGICLGYAWGTELVDNWVEERDGWWGGVRLGWDWHPQFGVETRLSFGSIDLWDHPAAVAAAIDRGLEPARDRWARSVEWDLGLLYYASQDDPWQPYILWGVGITRIDFADLVGTSYEGTYFTMPLALGLKYRPVSGPIFRFEIADQIIFPSRFNVTHQFSATVGLEMRFGKKRRLYWPWEPAWP